MEILRPETAEALAEALAAAGRDGKRIRSGGAFTKDAFGGPLGMADVLLSTAALKRMVRYEPRDLTVGVEAGMPYAELDRLLAANGQMLPLDPPLGERSTVGGVVAANLCGPRRRLYGAPRDLVIGMRFATLAGKLAASGGMVVKNVAGLDVSKLMIGSCGTLAVLVGVNFRVHAAPPAWRTLLESFDTAGEAIAARDRILRGVLQPAAVDMANPAAAARLGRSGYLVAVQAGGSPAVLDRYSREMEGAAALEGGEETEFWRRVRDFAPEWLGSAPRGVVARVSTTLAGVKAVLELAPPVVSRAGTGVSYVGLEGPDRLGEVFGRGWKAVVEWAAPETKESLELWPAPGDDIGVMRAIKGMFDPANLLNRGRLYGRL
jgi:glycolate oxidase FAD binding subunit